MIQSKATFAKLSDLKASDLEGKRVILRADFNVPIKSGRVANSYRLIKEIPTLKFLSKNGAKTIILSHLGEEKDSLKPVALFLSRHLKIGFSSLEEAEKKVANLKNGDILLLENLRLDAGEKNNDKNFAKKLATLGDFYVNDAFSVSHRSHASTVGLPKYLPSFAGPLFVTEYENLAKIFTSPKPFVLILGGMKFDTKIPLIKRYLNRADKIFVLGALAHIFFHKLGFNIGQSLIDQNIKGVGEFLKAKNIYLPVDVVVKTPEGKKIKSPEAVRNQDIIYDIGPETIKMIGESLKQAKTILWNGPLGNFEKGYFEATEALAKLVAKSSAYSVVGGGDTVAAIEKLKLGKKFGFVSTAGGAMLDFLANGTLPGIEALKNSKRVVKNKK